MTFKQAKGQLKKLYNIDITTEVYNRVLWMLTDYGNRIIEQQRENKR